MCHKFHFLAGGAERYLFDLREGLSKLGHVVVDFSTKNNRNECSEYSGYFVKGINFSKISTHNPLYNIKAALNFIYSFEAKKNIERLRQNISERRAQQKVYDAVSLLSQAIPNVAFASIPGNTRTFFLGVSQLLKQPEFNENPMQASQVFEVLEEGTEFLSTLNELEINDKARIFIGKENLLENIESCSLIVGRYQTEDFEGYLGLLGPTRMPYAFNLATLNEVLKLLRSL